VLNFRWGIFSAGAAFLISTVLGIIFGVGFLYIIIRGLVFAFIFFGFGFALKFLVNSFFPEFLSIGTEEAGNQNPLEQPPPSRENAIIDTMGEYAVPELYKTPGESSELGNIEDLVSGAFQPLPESIDRNEEEGYNEDNIHSASDMRFDSSETNSQENVKYNDAFQDLFPDSAAYSEPAPDVPKNEKPAVFTPSFGDDSDGLGGLPDLDSMAMAFGGGADLSSDFGGSSYSGMGETAAADIESPINNTGNKSQPIKGDFSPKELANGIRTVLSKEK